MTENKMITFKWETGHIDIMLHSILEMNTTELKKFVSAATVNNLEVKEEIAAFLHEIVDGKNENAETSKTFKKDIANWKKLLAVVEDRKLTKTEKLVQKILKNGIANRITKGVFQDAGKHCVCDGYRLVRFNNALSADIPTIPDSMDTAKAIGDVSAYSVKLNLPDVSELKKDIKIAKSGCDDVGHVYVIRCLRKAEIVYDFGYGLPMVNAEWLLDMLEILPDCEAFCIPGKKTYPVYFVSGDNDGLLLPCRKEQEYEQPPVEETAPAVETVSSAVAVESETVEAVEAAVTESVTAESESESAMAETVEIVAVDLEAVANMVNAASCSVSDSNGCERVLHRRRINSHLKTHSTISGDSEREIMHSNLTVCMFSSASLHPKNYKPPGSYT